jgi:hypothetical protein
MVVVGALTVEKILLTVSLAFSFGIVIPIACILGILFQFRRREMFKALAIRLGIFGTVLAFAIPTSVGVSVFVDNSFEEERNRLMQEVEVDMSNAEADASKKKPKEKNDKNAEKDTSTNNPSGQSGNFLSNFINLAGEFAANIGTTITGAVTGIIDSAQRSLKNLMLISVQWLISSCAVPILTLLGFGFVIKILFSFDKNSEVSKAVEAKLGPNAMTYFDFDVNSKLKEKAKEVQGKTSSTVASGSQLIHSKDSKEA